MWPRKNDFPTSRPACGIGGINSGSCWESWNPPVLTSAIIGIVYAHCAPWPEVVRASFHDQGFGEAALIFCGGLTPADFQIAFRRLEEQSRDLEAAQVDPVSGLAGKCRGAINRHFFRLPDPKKVSGFRSSRESRDSPEGNGWRRRFAGWRIIRESGVAFVPHFPPLHICACPTTLSGASAKRKSSNQTANFRGAGIRKNGCLLNDPGNGEERKFLKSAMETLN